MSDHSGTKVGKSTLYRWIESFVPRISEYVNGLAPQTSDTWHADELFVKMKGAECVRDKGSIAYLWNVMDRKTRFLLASRLSEKRDEFSAMASLNRAARVAHGSLPERILTDAHRSHVHGIRNSLRSGAEHIARAGVGKPHANNNRIERLNGTLRERVKVQRGWKAMDSRIAEGQRIHYDFVKPHAALGGQTPASAAGVGIEGQNKWLELLRAALVAKPQSEAGEALG